MDQSSIADAVKQICDEKGIPLESVTDTIEAALAAAYRKDFGEKNQNIKVEFDLTTGKSNVFDIKTVVEDVPEEELLAQEEEAQGKKGKDQEIKKPKPDKKKDGDANAAAPAASASTPDSDADEVRRFNPKTEIQISDAKKIKKSYKLDDIIKTQLKIPGDFGRMAAQTAKQVIIQKLRESERETLYEEFKDKQGEILVGTVQRREGALILVDLGRLTALLPPEEQIRNENYTPGSHLKIYIMSVSETTKGPEVIVSRSHPEIVKKLFFLEIPEIANGVVEIKSIAREAGGRSKIAVFTDQENIDPIGSCIGQRGARIQTIISELKGEKVDIIKYSEDPVEYISNALSPAKILDIKINEEERTAIAKVAEDQLSLAIGKAGQNVRLAAKLTGWKIDIIADKGDAESTDADAGAEDAEATKADVPEEKIEKKEKKSTTKAKKKKDEDTDDSEDSDKKEVKKEKKTRAKKGDVDLDDKKKEKKETKTKVKKKKDEDEDEASTAKSKKEKKEDTKE